MKLASSAPSNTSEQQLSSEQWPPVELCQWLLVVAAAAAETFCSVSGCNLFACNPQRGRLRANKMSHIDDHYGVWLMRGQRVERAWATSCCCSLDEGRRLANELSLVVAATRTTSAAGPRDAVGARRWAGEPEAGSPDRNLLLPAFDAAPRPGRVIFQPDVNLLFSSPLRAQQVFGAPRAGRICRTYPANCLARPESLTKR